MGKFDIEPCRGITNPDKESHIRTRAKVRRKNIKKIEDKKDKENKDKEFGSRLGVFEE